MREILFKAKRISDGKWIEGSLIVYPDQTTGIVYDIGDIEGMRKEVVRPETVCQYTGLTDKDGKKIFEGDILNENGEHFTVVYDSNWAKFKLQYLHAIQYPEWNRGVLMEVVGSIHDGEGGQHEGNE